MTTGTVSRPASLRGWFVMMKDSDGRYPGNNLWGDGWGWSWFDAASPSTPSLDLCRKNNGCTPSCAIARFDQPPTALAGEQQEAIMPT